MDLGIWVKITGIGKFNRKSQPTAHGTGQFLIISGFFPSTTCDWGYIGYIGVYKGGYAGVFQDDARYTRIHETGGVRPICDIRRS